VATADLSAKRALPINRALRLGKEYPDYLVKEHYRVRDWPQASEADTINRSLRGAWLPDVIVHLHYRALIV
jgi:hypothetical protein